MVMNLQSIQRGTRYWAHGSQVHSMRHSLSRTQAWARERLAWNRGTGKGDRFNAHEESPLRRRRAPRTLSPKLRRCVVAMPSVLAWRRLSLATTAGSRADRHTASASKHAASLI